MSGITISPEKQSEIVYMRFVLMLKYEDICLLVKHSRYLVSRVCEDYWSEIESSTQDTYKAHWEKLRLMRNAIRWVYS